MRSKAPLAMMEQVIMVLVFALAAALCLRAFVWADSQSARNADRDRAVLLAQSAAEALKRCEGDFAQAGTALGLGGQWDTSGWSVAYDENWQETAAEEGAYILTAQIQNSPAPLLGQALVTVAQADGEELFSLTVCWQEGVDGYE